MSFKKLSNLKGVKNFELYSDYNQFIIQGLSKFKIGYSSNIHLYVPEAIYSSPDYRICYIVSKQNYLEV